MVARCASVLGRALSDHTRLRRTTCALVTVASLGQASCFAFVRSQIVGRTCTPEAARSAGAEDGASGAAPDESYAALCGVEESYLNGVYRAAYDAATRATE